MIRYVRIRKDDAELRARLEQLAAERRRFGFRRLAVLLTPSPGHTHRLTIGLLWSLLVVSKPPTLSGYPQRKPSLAEKRLSRIAYDCNRTEAAR